VGVHVLLQEGVGVAEVVEGGDGEGDVATVGVAGAAGAAAGSEGDGRDGDEAEGGACGADARGRCHESLLCGLVQVLRERSRMVMPGSAPGAGCERIRERSRSSRGNLDAAPTPDVRTCR